MKLYKMFNNMDMDAVSKDVIQIQWFEILSHVTVGVGVHSKKVNKLNIGLASDTDEPELERMSKVAIGYILELIAQGDLCYTDLAYLKAMFDKPEHLKLKPYADPFNMDLFESEIYFYSDSAMELGTELSAAKFPEVHDKYLKDSRVKPTTNHGAPHGWIWDCEPGVPGLKMKNKIKSTIDVFYGGDPKKFKSRIVIFGCLNDLDT